ncbi:MAG: hypothetical protein RI883_556 [Bacteroidota bacterium]|jgi:hypothetical protein
MRLFLFGVFVLGYTCLFSQDLPDTLVVKDTIKVHSPKKAVIFSAIIPGAGQVYNHLAMPKGKKKAYWKVPLIYGALGSTTYFIIKNQKTQKSLKQEYSNRLNGGALNNEWGNYDDQGLLTLYDQYLNWRNLSILGFSAIYLVQIIDAGIEAHFVHFDISQDLSLAIEPAYFGQNTVGLKFNFNFH